MLRYWIEQSRLEWLMVASAGVEKMPLAEIADMGI